MTSNSKAAGRFGKQDFRYVAAEDAYVCPAGQRLAYSFTTKDRGLVLRRYRTNACQSCAIKRSCTTSKERLISRWEHEAVLETVQARLDQHNRTGWSSQAFLIAIMATAVLLGIVIRLFMRWRSMGQRTAEANLMPNKNSEGGEGKAPSETTIGNPSEVAMPIGLPLVDELIQLPDEAGQRAAISMNQNSGYSSKIVSTNEEVLPDTVLIEPSELSTTNSSAVENVARLAKLYAMGTPSEKEFQRLRGLISQSLRNSQAPI